MRTFFDMNISLYYFQNVELGFESWLKVEKRKLKKLRVGKTSVGMETLNEI
jgi:hypothetical protein